MKNLNRKKSIGLCSLLVLGAFLLSSYAYGNPDYYNYWIWNTGYSEAYGVDGWVGGDGTSRIIFYSGTTAYIYQVTTTAGPDGDNPNLHPDNPDATGAIAPRVFTYESQFALHSGSYGHDHAFYVGSDGFYLGAAWNGIEKYNFGGGYVGQVAPSAPSDWVQSLAYDPSINRWYTGSGNDWGGGADRRIYLYDEIANAADPTIGWQLAFHYTSEPGSSHHDGLEVLPNGNLLIADYAGQIVEYTAAGTKVTVHNHPPFPTELEGMGAGALGHYWGGSHSGQIFEFGGGSLPPLVMLEKEITSGPDVDGDGVIDVVVEVGLSESTEYDFTITQSGLGGLLIVDTVPAEWNVLSAESDNADDQVYVFPAGGGKPSKSATKIEWRPASASSSLLVWVETRQSPGKNNIKFAPTSCGPLYLNEDGAAAYEVDPETGEPLRDLETGEKLPSILVSNPLCLAAVGDVDGDGVIVRDGSGDEDGDGLTDFAEACLLGTDPCNPDTDGDGVPDGVDPDPLDPLIPGGSIL